MRYFGGKVGLLEALFEDEWQHLNARVERAIATAPSNRAALLNAMQAVVSAMARDADLARLALFEGRRIRGDEARVRVSRGHSRYTETIRTLVRKTQAARELDASLDVNAVTSAILGATEAMIRDRVLAKTGAARGVPEREIRRTLQAMLDGMETKAPAKKR